MDSEDYLQSSGLQDGDSITAVAQPKIAATRFAFAVWCVGGDRIATWGTVIDSATAQEFCNTQCFRCDLGTWNRGDMRESGIWW